MHSNIPFIQYTYFLHLNTEITKVKIKILKFSKIKYYILCFSMSNDCTYVNNLTTKNNFDKVNDNSSELVYKKIMNYQLNIKVEGKLYKYKINICIF